MSSNAAWRGTEQSAAASFLIEASPHIAFLITLAQR
jgi:hypothetical protein